MSGADGNSARRGTSRTLVIAILPLAIFIALALIFYKQLSHGGASSEIPSALIGKPAPAIALEALDGLVKDGNPVPGLTPELFAAMPEGSVALVNVWASWCAPCRIEHPLLVELAENGKLQVFGINYKDSTENALRFLGQLGNPYDAVGVDPKGRAAIEWGVYGVPETFVVGRDGIIKAKHVGPLTSEAIGNVILPLVAD